MDLARRYLVGAWRVLWNWGRVIWVCRIAVVSAIGGGLLLAATAQARDLFADLGLRWWHWLSFFALLFAWAWIAHAAARRALEHDDWVPEAHVEGGLTDARRKELQQEFFWPALLVPRLLGLAVFGLTIWAMVRTRINLEDAAEGLPEAGYAVTLATVLVAIAAVLTVVYVVITWRPYIRRRWSSREDEEALPPPLLLGTPPMFGGRDRRERLARQAREVVHSPVAGGLFVARVVVLVLLLVALVEPHVLATGLPRLFFAPVLFAGVALVFGEVAAWSHRLRTPLLLVLVGFAGVALYMVDRFHDVRWVIRSAHLSPVVGAERQIRMVEAVERWKRANQCLADTSACPRPIIVAGAGGASRAAFLTATVVGALIDLGGDPQANALYGNPRNRIFAMSTVSGSSVGALVMRAALADAAERGASGKPPCASEGTGSWFGTFARTQGEPGARFDVKQSWRDCFQVLLAGDFLSPVLVGLAYRDAFPLGNPFTGEAWWEDRASLLEQGFERRYHRLGSPDGVARSCGTPKTGPGLDPADETGLCRRFGYHPDPDVAGGWLPLLFINGTSVSTGRRIIVGDVRAGDRYAPDSVLFPFAYDLNEIATWAKPSLTSQPRPVHSGLRRDLRLSTAATMSARFPVISPHGNLRDRTGDVTDRIVDGGYFENEGLATAADIAAALKHFGLAPVIIRVVNEPVKTEADIRQLGPDRPLIPDESERTPFDGVTSILRALTATRSGHEEGHAAYAKGVVGDERFYEVGVYTLDPPQTAPLDQRQVMARQDNPLCRRSVPVRAALGHVSMSWWMSQPVQAYLDAQLCVRGNWERIECELREGRAGRGGACPKPG